MHNVDVYKMCNYFKGDYRNCNIVLSGVNEITWCVDVVYSTSGMN